MNCPMDEMILNRTDFTDKSTIGDLYIDGQWECFILEPTCRKIAGTKLAIPQGKYEVIMYESPKLLAKVARLKSQGKPISPILEAGRVPLYLNIPGHSYVEMHPGNKPEDTEDCHLPGQAKDVDYVFESESAWELVVAKIEQKLKAGKFYIGITGGAPNV